MKGGALYKENFWTDPKLLSESGCDIWSYEQKLGDCIIVPPQIPHTVLNKVTQPLSYNYYYEKR